MTDERDARMGILAAVHETAEDLHRLGFIDKRRMRNFDVLCLAPVGDYDADRIRALRERLNLSQALLAGVLNTSLSRPQVGDRREASERPIFEVAESP